MVLEPIVDELSELVNGEGDDEEDTEAVELPVVTGVASGEKLLDSLELKELLVEGGVV